MAKAARRYRFDCDDRDVTDIEIAQVDERDSSWEDHHPRFRVYLHGSGESSTYGWTDTYDVTGADVLQVIDWAQRQAGGLLTYAVALVSDLDSHAEKVEVDRGLTWLVGIDGNDNTDRDPRGAESQLRMLARRHDPVIIPAKDRLPDGLPAPYNDGTESR
ncbi:hypothetical protein [Aeromicrobium duanguangcaii]|uniref:Uncharacterized protein n=1 Tax=Aeromicrobium duanguangcaii TaxID=2968086 RepID=A0ABY5KLC0_9ACTN|nr:hypothetical protein [Aeromicrobium duanguangcaii]MCD9152942.1 hypothetical protein [Aeromicrobium duanguangcaii]UUI69952.1 hypothetical protein NP095_07615 [Aeromicrobium duanguangcaii]